MKRDEIYFANLDPTIGTEIKKKRPILIGSNNANNKLGGTVTIPNAPEDAKRRIFWDL